MNTPVFSIAAFMVVVNAGLLVLAFWAFVLRREPSCPHKSVTHFSSYPLEPFRALFSGKITSSEFSKMDLTPRAWTRCDNCREEWDR